MRKQMDSKNYIDINFVDNQKRDLVLILPGGGYMMTSIREAEPVAHIFFEAQFHTAIYYYRETLLLYPQVKDEAMRVVDFLKEHDLVNRLFLIGFSAGGHLAGMLMTAYDQKIHGTILAYPVITSHQAYQYNDLRRTLLGHQDASFDFDKISIEKQVTSTTPPVFLMHTVDDISVPVENTLHLLDALVKHHIPVELHLYPSGRHGVSIATKEVAFSDMDPDIFVQNYGYMSDWIHLAVRFLKRIS